MMGRRVHCIHIHNPYRDRVVRHWYSTRNNLLEGSQRMVYGPEPWEAVALEGHRKSDER
jgi:hypothetical protein